MATKQSQIKGVSILYKGEGYDLVDVDVDAIVIPEERFKAQQTDSSKTALETTLADLPMLNEIGIKQEETRLVLIYGESRIRELIHQGKKSVHAKLWQVSPETALYMQIAENAARGGYSKAQLLEYITRLLKSKKFKKAQVAKMLGVDPSEVTKLETINEMSDPLKTRFMERNVPVDVMYELRILSNDEARLRTLDTLLSGQYSKDTAKHFIRHIIAGLCDNCGTTSSSRNDLHALTFYDGKWLCHNCHKPPPPTPPKPGSYHPPVTKGEIGEGPNVIQEDTRLKTEGDDFAEIMRLPDPDAAREAKCAICAKPFELNNWCTQLCESDYERAFLLYAIAIKELGPDVATIPIEQLKGVKFAK